MVKTEFELCIFITVRVSSYYEGKDFNQDTNSLIFSTILEGDNLKNNNSTFISPIYTFPWRETLLFARQINVKKREKYFNHIFYQRKDADFCGKQTPFRPFFLHGPRLFHLSTEKVRVQSVGNGHQSGYSSADTKNNDINKRSNKISIKGKY